MYQNNLGSNILSKERLKLFIKNIAFGFAYKLAITRLKKIVKNSSAKPKIITKGKKRIVFGSIYAMYGRLIYWEWALAKAMQLRGHDVKVLTCGKTLPLCTGEHTISRLHDDKTCRHCVDFSSEFLEISKISYNTYKDYISEKEIEEIKDKVNKLSKNECYIYTYKNIEVGTLSKNATIRYFEGSIDPDEQFYLHILHSELVNSIIATKVAERFLKKEKVDILVSRHLGYSSWGSFAEYCIGKGVRVVSPGGGYKKNTLSFDMDDISNSFGRYYQDVRKKKFLNKDEEKELKSFFDSRISGKEGDTIDYDFSLNEIEEDLFEFNKYEKTYAMFPNVPWDSSLLNANRSFKDVYEWVSHTIELFKSKPNYQLIIKIHPSEFSVMKSKNTVLDYIKNNFSSLPENIKVIPPNTKISPYNLFKYIDVGVVYNGTIGLEMALNDIPVVVVGTTHYGEKGFTYDISSRDEYEAILSKKISTLPKQNDLAKVYAYFYFIKSFIPYNYVTMNKRTLNFGWDIKSFDDFVEGKNKYLDKICDYILNGNLYQTW